MSSSFKGLKALGVMACALAGALSLGAGCGDANGDIVYLHVIHGYPGSSSLSLFGTTGELVRDLPFNEDSGPIAIDRGRFNGQVTVLADGVPQTGQIDLTQQIFGMYKGETGTLMITNRPSGDASYSTLFMRHHILAPGTGTVFSTSPLVRDNYDCALEVHNAMAVTNAETATSFTISVQREMTQDQVAGIYDPSLDEVIQTECGDLNLRDARFPQGREFAEQRAESRGTAESDPWFWLAEFTDPNSGDSFLGYVAGAWLSDEQVTSIRPTVTYRDCMRQAIQIAAKEDEGGGMPGASTQEESPCDFGLNGPEIPVDVVDGEEIFRLEYSTADVEACTRGLDQYPLLTWDPIVGQASEREVIYSYADPNSGTCGAKYRVRTAYVDQVFDPDTPQGNGFPNPPGSGSHVTLEYDAPNNTYQYLVVYGLPLNPAVRFINGVADGKTQDFFDNGNSQYPDDGTYFPSDNKGSRSNRDGQ